MTEAAPIPPRRRIGWPGVLLFGLALMAAGLVVATLLWSGAAPYADLARENGVRSVVFVADRGEVRYDIGRATELHQAWSSYVTGGRDDQPEPVDVPFGADERSHMTDVRRVFDVVKFLVPTSLVVMILLLQRAGAAGAREQWRLVRDGAAAAVAVALGLALLTLLAFDALFLAFHYVFFPQGNFLFDPRTSNIVRLWPQWYFEGMFLRVGLSYLATAAVVAATAALRLRRAK